MKKDRYVYPAIFSYDSDGISISFPDLPGCFSCGSDDEEALYMARDALGLWMSVLEEEKEEIPASSKLCDIPLASNEHAVLVDVWMPLVRKAVRNRSVKKTLSIPQWLNEKAMQEDINFSYVLQEALKKELNL